MHGCNSYSCSIYFPFNVEKLNKGEKGMGREYQNIIGPLMAIAIWVISIFLVTVFLLEIVRHTPYQIGNISRVRQARHLFVDLQREGNKILSEVAIPPINITGRE
jgi:hypothetical protein